MKTQQPLPDQFRMCVHRLDAETTLAENIHVGRHEWTTERATGHRALNSVYGENTGAGFIEDLKSKVNFYNSPSSSSTIPTRHGG